MVVQCSVQGVSTSIRQPVKRIRKFTLFLVIVFVLSTVVFKPAGAISTSLASGFVMQSEETTSLQSSPSRIVGDSCLPLLHTVSDVPGSPTVSNRRPAGKKAATVGFVLGLRTALGPTEFNGLPRVSNKKHKSIENHVRYGAGYALAVASYRQCKSEQALQALNDERIGGGR